ncbi:hypothetical protein NDU88_002534 [Pleurodeles waltl]|uniref:Uncharacterized protein n=1 Tax=Pleurodeles waltl TaxID=8319 RepID=A0AAV7KSE3_PLEWA|nr:hypothetical protein NDU88_002534 [Pleurodeles waltl]
MLLGGALLHQRLPAQGITESRGPPRPSHCLLTSFQAPHAPRFPPVRGHSPLQHRQCCCTGVRAGPQSQRLLSRAQGSTAHPSLRPRQPSDAPAPAQPTVSAKGPGAPRGPLGAGRAQPPAPLRSQLGAARRSSLPGFSLQVRCLCLCAGSCSPVPRPKRKAGWGARPTRTAHGSTQLLQRLRLLGLL